MREVVPPRLAKSMGPPAAPAPDSSWSSRGMYSARIPRGTWSRMSSVSFSSASTPGRESANHQEHAHKEKVGRDARAERAGGSAAALADAALLDALRGVRARGALVANLGDRALLVPGANSAKHVGHTELSANGRRVDKSRRENHHAALRLGTNLEIQKGVGSVRHESA